MLYIRTNHFMIFQPTCVLQMCLLVCFGLHTISPLVAVNNLDLISERDDEKSSSWSSQEEPQSHGNRSARVTLIKWSWKYRGVVSQAEAWCVPKARPFLLTLHLPLTSLFYSHFLIFPPLYSNSSFKSFLLSSSKTHTYSLTCVHTLFLHLSLLCSQIMVLTDPEFESSVLISSDEGASYQKYRLTFYVLSLLFHPTEEDWALAYSHDQKVRLCLMSYLFSVLITISCMWFT